LSNDPAVIAVTQPPPADRNPVSMRFLPYAIGSCCGFRRDVWSELGGFDEDWIRGSTETEFFWRAQLAGHSLGFVADAVVDYRLNPDPEAQRAKLRVYARAMPRLFKSFRSHGVPRSSTWNALRAWIWLAYRSPWLVAGSPEQRTKWCNVADWRLGLLQGSLRYRAVFL
jgi:GT2 family glycosyltransferase